MTDSGPIWIDLANSPHVLFFAPIVRELRNRGARVVLTSRDFAQTVQLARLHGLDATPVGSHGGRGTWAKLRAVVGRAASLAALARGHRPALAASHNSYAQAIAARRIGVPVVTSVTRDTLLTGSTSATVKLSIL